MPESTFVDSAIAALIAREMFEGAMFYTTHRNAVTKNDSLKDEEKKTYLTRFNYAVAAGVSVGLIISIIVGFSLAAALDQLDNADYGFAIAEGISKAIAAVFVVDMALKVPKWLDISNYPKDEMHVTDKLVLSSSLFWNVVRESCEAGVLTSITVLFASHTSATTAASVVVGIVAAVGGGGAIAFGVKHLNKIASALFATIMIMMLATGLVVGAAHEFEEAYEVGSGEEPSDTVYEAEDNAAVILKAFGWCGIQKHLTVAALVVWVFTVVFLCAAEIWNNYLGYDMFPKLMTNEGHSPASVPGQDAGDSEAASKFQSGGGLSV